MSDPRELEIARRELQRLGYLSHRVERFLLRDALEPVGEPRALALLAGKVGLLAGITRAFVLELAASNEMTSALRRFAAMSKAMRVRVLGSRKRLTIVLPRRAGTFFTLRESVRLNATAVAWICSISASESSSRVSRWRRCQGIGERRMADFRLRIDGPRRAPRFRPGWSRVGDFLRRAPRRLFRFRVSEA